MTETVFGPVVSTWDLEQAVVKTLREWFNEYLRDIEIKRGFARKTLPRPPAPESFRGGVDFETFKQDTNPTVITVVKPQGTPELRGDGGYAQGYDVSVGCVWAGTGSTLAQDPQDETRAVASLLGAAVSMLVLNQPVLEHLSERVRLATAPELSFPSPERRDIALSTTRFDIYVSTIVEEGKGPLTIGKPYEEPYPAEPTVLSHTTTVTGEPVETPL